MTESKISFKELTSSIKQIVDLTLLNPKEYDKFEMSTILYETGKNIKISIPRTTDYYRLKVIQYIRTESQKWKSVISDEYITNELTDFVFELKTTKEKYSQFDESVTNWLQHLKTLPRINYRFVLPVNNVDYRKDIEFDKIKLKKLTLDVLRSFVPFLNDKIKDFSAKVQFNELIKYNQTEIFAFIDVKAKDKKQGKILAESYLKRLIHAIRLFNPRSGITERERYFPETKLPYLIVNLDKKGISLPFESLHLNPHVWPSEEYWDRVEPDWMQLSKFLFSDNPNEIQSLILTALYWYGEAGKETEDQLSKFLKYMYGLESLLIFDRNLGKTKKISQRLAKINSKENPKDFDFYSKLMTDYYEFRSGMVHSGKLTIDNEDVATTHKWLHNLIFDYIRFSKKYDHVKDLFQNEYSLDIASK